MFAHVIGQTDITDRLKAALDQDRLAHAWLFHGPEGTGKRAVAYDLAQALLCSAGEDRPCGVCGDCVKVKAMDHPDLLWLLPTRTGGAEKQKEKDLLEARKAVSDDLYCPPVSTGNRLIALSQVKELHNRCSLRAFSGGWRIFVIQEVELLNVQSANALLKLLEEPPPSVLLLLTSNEPDKLLSTIVSRCVGIRFPGLPVDALMEALRERHDVSPEQARIISELSGGGLAVALRALDKNVEEAMSLAEKLMTDAFAPRNVPLPLETMEDIAHSGDSQLFKDILTIVRYWCRQAYVEEVSRTETAAVPPKILTTLRNGGLKLAREIIEEIEKSIDLIDRNVYIFLIGSVFLIRLRDLTVIDK